jgi:hypothetical protein
LFAIKLPQPRKYRKKQQNVTKRNPLFAISKSKDSQSAPPEKLGPVPQSSLPMSVVRKLGN